ncbi:MAG: threonine--tRNA ligase [Candidatus Omnitrophica bacterium]|nr:threonine--tRNA ligase [Candidatus Omnitrophota bacterium]
MNLDILRHSAAHILAYAVKELWPDVKLGIGPAIEDGFYYDFERSSPFSENDLRQIEEKMKEIVARNESFLRQELSKQEAEDLFRRLNESYKLSLLKDITTQTLSIYKTGQGFVDLCRGPHVESSGKIQFFRLLSVSGCYWHGIETNPMLQRIYGTCFEKEEELLEYLKNIEERKLRDHRRLGVQLDLFNIYYDQAGAGLVFYCPKGAILRDIIENYTKKRHLDSGYDMVVTPHIMRLELWKTSGHLEYYKENMYSVFPEGLIESNNEFILKPMNCPGHILIYKSKLRSYKDLPIRLFELGTVYRYEKSGVLHGLMRLRGFTQDDAHIFCTEEQLTQEIVGIIDFTQRVLHDFGFDQFDVELSTRPERSIGSDEDWHRAERALKDALDEKKMDYNISAGEGAFYGPKIDIKLRDVLKRKWQCATIQCDFALAQRFNLEYVDSSGAKKQVIMLHRVILGSLERFIGVLIEHYAGAFPLWLSPVQLRIITVKSEFEDYAGKIKERLKDAGFRVELDMRSETLQKRIRETEMQKIPYALIVGEREVKSDTIAVRKRGNVDMGAMPLEEFIARLKKEGGGFY